MMGVFTTEYWDYTQFHDGSIDCILGLCTTLYWYYRLLNEEIKDYCMTE